MEAYLAAPESATWPGGFPFVAGPFYSALVMLRPTSRSERRTFAIRALNADGRISLRVRTRVCRDAEGRSRSR
jgi:hypothetical protein